MYFPRRCTGKLIQQPIRGLTAFLVATGFWILAAGPAVSENQRNHSGNPFEPTVTRAENRLLNAVFEIANTNTALAVHALIAADLATASPALDFTLGNLYFANDNLDAAAAAYRDALVKLPRFRAAMVNLGRVYLLQDRAGDVIALYRQLVQDGQADADTLLLLGNALLMQGHPASAETAYRQALLLRPQHAETILGMVKSLLYQERYAESLALTGELLRSDPAGRTPWSLRVHALLALERHDSAARAIETAWRLGCADDGMLAMLGDLYLYSDQPEDALRAYEESFRGTAPPIARVLRALEGFLLAGDLQGAQRMIERVKTLRDRMPEELDAESAGKLLRLQAATARLNGQLERAIEFCREALRLDPLDGATLLLLARLQHEHGSFEEAVLSCERAARIRGYEADALVQQARIEADRGNYARAVPLLEAAQTFRDQPHVRRYLEQLRRMTDVD